ncbi:MAG: hypothetical protein Q4A58_03470 [Fusobacterium sp.]|uniref:hypothetical protein n=1 Tax=Fusobacterium sp. TaxID=68766 RepID=UPI0026DC84D9|nr:hypothetical protein [Fusobacterium sp.]MDO4690337.1 hypothetical protein [Fusobacterium sp.]
MSTTLAIYADPTISKEVIGTNKQQLDVKEIDTEELLLKNQNLESSSVEISGENFKEKEDKVKVQQTNKAALEEELSQGVENKSYLKYILGGLGVVALIIAL